MQDSKELITPVTNKKVLIRGYVTGLIDQQVKTVLMESNKATYEIDSKDIDSSNELPKNGKMIMQTDPTAQLKADNKLLELMVLAIDGNNGDVFNRLMDLPMQDVDFVMTEVKKLQAVGEVGSEEKKA